MIVNTPVQIFFSNNIFIISCEFSKFKNMDWLVNWIVSKLKFLY
jgi:hypothetical protein